MFVPCFSKKKNKVELKTGRHTTMVVSSTPVIGTHTFFWRAYYPEYSRKITLSVWAMLRGTNLRTFQLKKENANPL